MSSSRGDRRKACRLLPGIDEKTLRAAGLGTGRPDVELHKRTEARGMSLAPEANVPETVWLQVLGGRPPAVRGAVVSLICGVVTKTVSVGATARSVALTQ